MVLAIINLQSRVGCQPVCFVTLPLIRVRVSPTHQELANVLKDFQSESFSEDISFLIACVDLFNVHSAVEHMLSEEVILNGNVL